MSTSRATPGEPIALRRAVLSDAGAISRVLHSAFAEFRERYTPEAYAASVPAESGITQRFQEGPLWIAHRGSTAVGTVAAVHTRDLVMIRGMAVSPLARGFGLGRTLLRSAEDFAREEACTRIVLYTTAFLTAAIALYRSAGYTFTGDAESPHGTELLRMSRSLG